MKLNHLFSLFLLIVLSVDSLFGQQSAAAAQTVQFAVRTVQRSAFVGPSAVAIPFTGEDSQPNVTRAGSFVLNSHPRAAKKITMALDASVPNGLVLQVHLESNALASISKESITTTPTEVLSSYDANCSHVRHQIDVRYGAEKSSEHCSGFERTVVVTMTE